MACCEFVFVCGNHRCYSRSFLTPLNGINNDVIGYCHNTFFGSPEFFQKGCVFVALENDNQFPHHNFFRLVVSRPHYIVLEFQRCIKNSNHSPFPWSNLFQIHSIQYRVFNLSCMHLYDWTGTVDIYATPSIDLMYGTSKILKSTAIMEPDGNKISSNIGSFALFPLLIWRIAFAKCLTPIIMISCVWSFSESQVSTNTVFVVFCGHYQKTRSYSERRSHSMGEWPEIYEYFKNKSSSL